MATSSFDREFVVDDAEISERVQKDLESAERIVVRVKNNSAEQAAALESIKSLVSNSASD